MRAFFPKWLATLGVLAGTVSFSGCAGYHIGSAKPAYLAKIHTLAVPIFKNKTLEPHIEAPITDSVIQQIQQDGTYTITDQGEADAILEGTIESIVRRRARSVRGNVEATSEFNLSVDIAFRLVDRATGTLLDAEKVTGTTSFFVGLDLQQQEYQAVMLAAQEAAVNLTSKISEGW